MVHSSDAPIHRARGAQTHGPPVGRAGRPPGGRADRRYGLALSWSDCLPPYAAQARPDGGPMRRPTARAIRVSSMSTPEFVLALREKIGTAPLWLAGVTAVVVRGDEVLLVRRSDTGTWTPVTGIIDPGEEPAVAAVREVEEEAGVVVWAERLVAVRVTDPMVYPNGDRSQYLDVVFRLGWVSGNPHPADGENTAAGWFGLNHLPPMSLDMRQRVQAAVDNHPEAAFAS